MLAKLKHGSQDLISVLPVVATALNESNLERSTRNPDGTAQSLLQVMTGSYSKRQILRVLPLKKEFSNEKTITYVRTTQVFQFFNLQSALIDMLEEV